MNESTVQNEEMSRIASDRQIDDAEGEAIGGSSKSAERQPRRPAPEQRLEGAGPPLWAGPPAVVPATSSVTGYPVI